MIRFYGVGVFAFMAVLILNRGFYAIGDTRTPVRIGVVVVVCNLLLNLVFIWWLKGKGLALATSLAAMIQTVLSIWLIREKVGSLDLSKITRTFLRASLATIVMAAIISVELLVISASDQILYRLIRVMIPLISAVVIYLLLARVLGLHEITAMLRSGKQPADEEQQS